MLKETIENIKDRILEKNTYFQEGITDVYQNEDYGIVLSNDVAVFPSADKGNYFYLRLPQNVTLSNGGIFAISDSIKGVGLNADIVLVAVVKEAKEDILLNNLINTIQGYCGENIDFTTAIYNPNEVIKRELAFMTKESRDQALSNLPDNLAIVSLSFTYSIPFVYNQCILNPCSC